MDVDSDGSDGDRMPAARRGTWPTAPTTSPSPPTAGRKTTKQPNPLLPRWEKKLKEAQAAKNPSRSTIDQLKREIEDMKYRSFLLAKADPYMVVPLSFLGYHRKNGWGPQVGDYAVVIYENKVYPVIIGDAGPSYKMGEASLRLAKALNEKASIYSRPVSDLKVTYLVFPQSRDPFGPPDLEKWRAKCAEYVEKIGGLGEGYDLHVWSDWFVENGIAADGSAETPES